MTATCTRSRRQQARSSGSIPIGSARCGRARPLSTPTGPSTSAATTTTSTPSARPARWCRTYATDDYIRSSPVISGTMMYFGERGPQGVRVQPRRRPPRRRTGRCTSTARTRPGRAVAYRARDHAQPLVRGGLDRLRSRSPWARSALGRAFLPVEPERGRDRRGCRAPPTRSRRPRRPTAAATRSPSPSGRACADELAGHRHRVGARGHARPACQPLGPGERRHRRKHPDRGLCDPGHAAARMSLLRGVGPTLGSAPFNVPGVLAHAAAHADQLRDRRRQSRPDRLGRRRSLCAARSPRSAPSRCRRPRPTRPSRNRFPPGSYTSQVAGVGGTPGVALAEIYDADPELDLDQPGQHLGARQRRHRRKHPDRGLRDRGVAAGHACSCAGSAPRWAPRRSMSPAPSPSRRSTSSIRPASSSRTMPAGTTIRRSPAAFASSRGLCAPGRVRPTPRWWRRLPAGSYTLQLSGVGGRPASGSSRSTSFLTAVRSSSGAGPGHRRAPRA